MYVQGWVIWSQEYFQLLFKMNFRICELIFFYLGIYHWIWHTCSKHHCDSKFLTEKSHWFAFNEGIKDFLWLQIILICLLINVWKKGLIEPTFLLIFLILKFLKLNLKKTMFYNVIVRGIYMSAYFILPEAFFLYINLAPYWFFRAVGVFL